MPLSAYKLAMNDSFTLGAIGRLVLAIDYFQATKITLFHLTSDVCVQFHLLDFIGSLFVCRRYRLTQKFEKFWMEPLFSCFLMQFGYKMLHTSCVLQNFKLIIYVL